MVLFVSCPCRDLYKTLCLELKLTRAALTAESSLGLGTDVWAIPFDRVTTIFKLVYAAFPMYTVGGALIRISIVLFCMRIFGPKRIFVVTLAVNIVAQLAWLIVDCLPCMPPSLFWTEWWNDSTGVCRTMATYVVSNILSPLVTRVLFRAEKLQWVGAGMSVSGDVWLLIAPLPELYRLNMSLRRKMMVGSMFVVGILGVAVSIVRLLKVGRVSFTTNPTGESPLLHDLRRYETREIY